MAEKLSKLPPGVPEAFLELLEDWVQFCPAIARLCGNAAAGLMLSKAYSWSRTREVIARGGWFWKTAEEWEQETCLSRREQQTAREIIRSKGFWEEDKKKIDGAPTLHFRVNFETILEAHIGEARAKLELAETPNREMAETPNPTPVLAKKEIHESAKSYKEAKTHSVNTTNTNTKAQAPFVLPEWIPPETWQGFEEMRRKIRKPMTDRARQMIVNELDRLRARGHPPGAVLDQSTRKCWQDVYELKGVNDGAAKTAAGSRANRNIEALIRSSVGGGLQRNHVPDGRAVQPGAGHRDEGRRGDSVADGPILEGES